jgi:glycopeptide antibiotics resistance protein
MEFNKCNRWLQALVWLTIVVYGAALIYLLFIRDRLRYMPGNAPHLFSWDLPYANLKPFHTIHVYLFHANLYNFDTWFQVFFGNLVLFLPFGILAPLLSRRMLSFPRFLLVLFLVLLGVELTQKFTSTGAFDVDDIILNLTGGIVGFALVRLFINPVKR